MLEHYREAASGKSNTEARNLAASIVGSEIDWDWDCLSLITYTVFDIDCVHSAAHPRRILPHHWWD